MPTNATPTIEAPPVLSDVRKPGRWLWIATFERAGDSLDHRTKTAMTTANDDGRPADV